MARTQTIQPKTFTTEMPIPSKDIRNIKKATLVFHGINHAGPSYEARIFLNNKKANQKTKKPAQMVMQDLFTYSVMEEDAMADQVIVQSQQVLLPILMI